MSSSDVVENSDICLSIGVPNHETEICSGFADLARDCLQKGYHDAKSAMRFYEGLNPNFKDDTNFQNLFPIVFNIENMKHKLKYTQT